MFSKQKVRVGININGKETSDKVHLSSGIKDILFYIMDAKLIYTPNDNIQNYLFCRIELLVKKFKHCLFKPKKKLKRS